MASRKLSKATESYALGVLVHDSDRVVLKLYERGRQVM
jgi:hypothetical protein